MPTDGVFGKVKCQCETKAGKFFCPRCICQQDDNSNCDNFVARCEEVGAKVSAVASLVSVIDCQPC